MFFFLKKKKKKISKNRNNFNDKNEYLEPKNLLHEIGAKILGGEVVVVEISVRILGESKLLWMLLVIDRYKLMFLIEDFFLRDTRITVLRKSLSENKVYLFFFIIDSIIFKIN